MAHKDDLGRWGERVAGDYLATEGYEIIARGWRCPRGEIDIIARRGDSIAFIEVKTRRTVRYGHPLEAITPAKFSRLRVLAGEWCRSAGSSTARIRIDGIGIVGDGVLIESLDHRQAIIG